MKPINKYINESNSNVDKFIEFILSDSKEGELETCHKSWYDYYEKCNPFDNQKFSQNVDMTAYAEDYCEEHELDTVFDDEEGFTEYIKNVFDESDSQLAFEFERGLIKCERVIDVQEDSFDIHRGHLGIYWSYFEGMGDSHGSVGNSRNNVVVSALVDPKDVNWKATIAANMIDPDEYEVTLNEGAPIQITRILEKKSNDILIEKNIIYYA